MPSHAISTEDFQFSVDSALLGELGEKLVSQVHVALAELVKNAYDADSTRVHIRISPSARGAPRVLIEDDGVGMSLLQVKRYWMKIGTSNKLAEPLTEKYGRRKTGSKGIGRFACRRLGLRLRLTTCATVRVPRTRGKRYQTTEIEFDWRDFKTGVDVESIKCSGSTTITKRGSTGTKLDIWGGEVDEWQARGFDYLQRQLAILASNRGTKRAGHKDDPGFEVTLTAPGLSEQNIDIREAVIDASWGTLVAAVDDDGRATCVLHAKGLGGAKRLRSKQRFAHIAGTSIRLGILPARKEEARRPQLLASYVLATLVEDWGGVQVRHNGFRVFPYGNAGDDWLHIDADRGRRRGRPDDELFNFAQTLNQVDAGRSLLNMLGMRNYIGQVELSSDIEGLTPRIDRQGFIENEVFDEIRRFARFAIDWANIHRDHYIQLRQEQDAEEARNALRPILDLEGALSEAVVPKAAAYLRKELKRIVRRLPISQQKDTETNLLRTVRVMETSSVESYRQLRHLRLVASASTLTLLFAHEVRTVIGTLGAASARLEQLSRGAPSHSDEFRSLGLQLKEAKARFDSLVGMTGIVGAFRRTDTLVNLHLKTAVDRAVTCFQLILGNYEISIDDTDVPAGLIVGPMIEGELYTVLLNVLSNAIKSVIAAGRRPRTIRFDARKSGNRAVLHISDTGLGLAEEFFDEVFTPFISDPSGELYDRLEERSNPEDSSILGTGGGLGLSIARDVARSRAGDVRFVVPESPWSACVEIELP